MFGSLVVVFPTPHKGGELILTEKDQSWTFDAAQALSNILPVKSGARITLTFSLYFEDSTPESTLPVIPRVLDQSQTIKNAMTELLAEPRIVDGSINTLCFGLSHSYPLSRYLKGCDALLFRVCKDLKLAPNLQVFHMGDEEFGYLGQDLVDPPEMQVDELDDMLTEEGLEKVQTCEMFWVTKPSGAGMKANYVAYGNQASLESVYGEICIVVRLEDDVEN
ncbi:hypothetical protein BDP27DRAFT_1335045 [Rhodocollybia butyracea]|uniref:Uncharacterized protein n=1 Tax=Rhodocollybia butyracea TaxID=206335 RepID=A0A9P5PD81_9AGAR|nr:hypothetical protein BDP27DRAFT_1335045 [Rhodocollybia butyracea]